jgi:hypothetical protein
VPSTQTNHFKVRDTSQMLSISSAFKQRFCALIHILVKGADTFR